MQLLERGHGYEELRKSFVIFICQEDATLPLGDEAVRKAKRNREWRREYMMLWMRDRENIERGMEQGMKEGIQQERCSIITRMLSQGFSDEQIKRVCDTSDEEIEECRKRADAVG